MLLLEKPVDKEPLLLPTKTTKRVVLVEVTETDIAAGVRQDPRSCPIAQALTRLGYKGYAVTQLSVYDTQSYKVADMPRTASLFVYQFDMRLHVEPVSFYLNL